MLLAVHARNRSPVKDGSRVVEPAIIRQFGETNDSCDGVARQWCEHDSNFASGDCETRRVCAVVGQATEDRLRAAQKRDVRRFALLDTSTYQREGVQ
jgi:hypothetical protein